VGNKKANSFWEANRSALYHKKKPLPDSDKVMRDAFILAKYEEMEFAKLPKEYLLSRIHVAKKRPSFVRRWFVLRNESFELYESKEKEDIDIAIEKWELKSITVNYAEKEHIAKEKKIDPLAAFQIIDGNKIYVVSCPDLHTLDDWLYPVKMMTGRVKLKETRILEKKRKEEEAKKKRKKPGRRKRKRKKS